MIDAYRYSLIMDEIRDLDDIIKGATRFIQKYPDDYSLQLTIDQAEIRINNLRKQIK